MNEEVVGPKAAKVIKTLHDSLEAVSADLLVKLHRKEDGPIEEVVAAVENRPVQTLASTGEKKAEAGTKYDAGKPATELIAPDAMIGLANILGYGAQKYDSHNWCKGMSWGRILGGVLRHLWAFARGEDLDQESGLPHIDHAMCGCMFLSSYQKRKAGTDDRYKL